MITLLSADLEYVRNVLPPLPEMLLRPGPKGLLVWQWLGLPVLALVAFLLGASLGRLAARLLLALAKRTRTAWDDAVVARLRGPLTFVIAITIAFLGLPLLNLHDDAASFISRILRTALLIAFFWGLVRSVDVVGDLVQSSSWAVSHSASRSLVPLAVRVSKVAVVVLGVVAVISELGYPVTSLIAGLGIGGLALALASQKTVENLFGAFSIGVDQPFREGDFIKVEDFVGTVEAIGLRSTRIRTLDRTVITIPNGKLAEMRTESYTARDRIRLFCTLGLVYGTTADQMRSVLAELERTLREHPRIWADAVIVRFKEFGASSLDIEVMAWFLTADFGEFQLIRQEVFLQFMEVVEKAGTSFAFPTRTIHLSTGAELAKKANGAAERVQSEAGHAASGEGDRVGEPQR